MKTYYMQDVAAYCNGYGATGPESRIIKLLNKRETRRKMKMIIRIKINEIIFCDCKSKRHR